MREHALTRAGGGVTLTKLKQCYAFQAKVMEKFAETDCEEIVMRSRVFALLLAAIGLALIPAAAEAGHRRHHHYHPHQDYNHRGWVGTYDPYYHRHYRSDWEYDRYAYYATPRRYYPSYNSGYWRPTYELRIRRDYYRPYASLPPYYQAWGYPKRHYVKRKYRRHHW